MYGKNENDREHMKMLSALATVSSLGLMTVFDFALAYWGGNWLDTYFQTSGHPWRMGCISIAILTVFLTFFKLIYNIMLDKDEE